MIKRQDDASSGAPENGLPRRDFLKTVLAGLPALALDWNSFPRGPSAAQTGNSYDAIIIGAGLGGLSCAAAFARQNFRPLVLEQAAQAGGYATTFKRPGGFVFDVSLHSTGAGERAGVHNLIDGFPEIKDVDFAPLPYLYRAIFPGYDIRVPQKSPAQYVEILARLFPDEKAGIQALLADMYGLNQDIARFSESGGKVDMAEFAKSFPCLIKFAGKTWGWMQDTRLKDPKLKAIMSALWGYFGLPPSKLSVYYYALPTVGYLEQGGYYPKGRSQAISQALVKFIQDRGGTVKLGARVDRVVVRDHAATGVRTADGTEYSAKVVIANANPLDVFGTMIDEKEFLKDYLARLGKLSVSLSSFQVFLGLKKDLVGELKIPDAEIFCSSGFDDDAAYRNCLDADMKNPAFGLMIYDNVYKGYSPPGKNTLNILSLQGFEHWAPFEEDYRRGEKKAYRAEKERMAGILIKRVEETILPGLAKAVEVKEIGTPLTNWRYTRNYRGAIYGFDQTIENSGPTRLPHRTPIRNLYLAGAWTQPGHGYGAVIPSGLQCFGEVMKSGRPRPETSRMNAIVVEELRKQYKDVRAVDGVSFALGRGEIFGMVGPNGAGKTTTIECLEGLRRPTSGRVSVLGLDPERQGTELRERIGVQLQQSALPERLRVAEALDLFASFYRRALDWRPIVRELGLEEKTGASFGKLSGGQKQRLYIALALINDPEVIFLDELTTGLDPQARRAMWALVKGIRERGKTVFLTTHFMEEAEQLCDRVAVMDHGRIVALDTPARLIESLGAENRVVFGTEAPVDLAPLKAIGGVTRVEQSGGRVIIYGRDDELVVRVVMALAAGKVRFRDLRTEQPSLEDVFLTLTGKEMRD